MRTKKYLVERRNQIHLLLLGRVTETDFRGVQRLPRQHRRPLRMHTPHICTVIADPYRLFDQHQVPLAHTFSPVRGVPCYWMAKVREVYADLVRPPRHQLQLYLLARRRANALVAGFRRCLPVYVGAACTQKPARTHARAHTSQCHVSSMIRDIYIYSHTGTDIYTRTRTYTQAQNHTPHARDTPAYTAHSAHELGK